MAKATHCAQHDFEAERATQWQAPQHLYTSCGFMPVLYPLYESSCGMLYVDDTGMMMPPEHIGCTGNGNQNAQAHCRQRCPGVSSMHLAWGGTLPRHLQQPANCSRFSEDDTSNDRPKHKICDESIILTLNNLPKSLCHRKRFRAMLEACQIRSMVQSFEVYPAKSEAVIGVPSETEAQHFVKFFNDQQLTPGSRPVSIRYSAAARSCLEKNPRAERAYVLKAKNPEAQQRHQRSPSVASTESTAPSTTHDDSPLTAFANAPRIGRWADVSDDYEGSDDVCHTSESGGNISFSTSSDADLEYLADQTAE